jgi:hypothetical protein
MVRTYILGVEEGLMLAPEKRRNLSSQATNELVLCINKMILGIAYQQLTEFRWMPSHGKVDFLPIETTTGREQN